MRKLLKAKKKKPKQNLVWFLTGENIKYKLSNDSTPSAFLQQPGNTARQNCVVNIRLSEPISEIGLADIAVLHYCVS